MRFLTYTLVTSAIALISAGSVQADDSTVNPVSPDRSGAVSSENSDADSPAPVAGMTVFIDEETGEFRAPSAAEAAELAAAMQSMLTPGARSAAAATPTEQTFADGTVGVDLGLSQLMFSVATIGADGKIARECAHGPDTAAAHLHNHVPALEEK